MKEYEDTVREYLVERKWDTLRPSNIAKSISIEAAELLEIFQWDNQSLEEVKGDATKIERIKGELADVFLYCLDMSVLLGFDTGKIVMDKLEKVKLKYPAEQFKDRDPAQDAGTEEGYWKIKKDSRMKGE